MNALQTTIDEYLRAGFAGLWVVTQEPMEALNSIAELCAQTDRTGLRFDPASGLQPLLVNDQQDDMPDPHAALTAMAQQEKIVQVWIDCAHLAKEPGTIANIRRALDAGKRQQSALIILAHDATLTPALGRDFAIIEHALPSREELAAIAQDVATEPGDLPDNPAPVFDAAAGLTRTEAENAYSLSIVRHGSIKAEEIQRLKAEGLRKNGLLRLYQGGESFDNLGGARALKIACAEMIACHPEGILPKGVLLLGPSGTGKSHFAKALGVATNRPTLILDIGRLMGSLVGQTEERTRQALATADAMAPCILMIDELEKGLSGAGGATDSGVSTRLLGTLLTWMQDHESDVFLICTANNIERLTQSTPELFRPGRFDGLYLIDLPNEATRNTIWEIHRDRYNIDPDDTPPVCEGWTGAEIEHCCRIARLRGQTLQEAARAVIPVATTAGEKIAHLRDWARGRVLDAETGQEYSPTTTRRQIERD